MDRNIGGGPLRASRLEPPAKGTFFAIRHLARSKARDGAQNANVWISPGSNTALRRCFFIAAESVALMIPWLGKEGSSRSGAAPPPSGGGTYWSTSVKGTLVTGGSTSSGWRPLGSSPGLLYMPRKPFDMKVVNHRCAATCFPPTGIRWKGEEPMRREEAATRTLNVHWKRTSHRRFFPRKYSSASSTPPWSPSLESSSDGHLRCLSK
mmetsp:Transcript_44133/g.89083  ORF Transcript_44133/g.89083 Transcript_44133/m.89083 type:complete len:208 (+) Transcript_44133:686-1309(+)